MPPQCGAFSRDLQDQSQSPRYSPGVGGPWLQMTSALQDHLSSGLYFFKRLGRLEGRILTILTILSRLGKRELIFLLSCYYVVYV